MQVILRNIANFEFGEIPCHFVPLHHLQVTLVIDVKYFLGLFMPNEVKDFFIGQSVSLSQFGNQHELVLGHFVHFQACLLIHQQSVVRPTVALLDPFL